MDSQIWRHHCRLSLSVETRVYMCVYPCVCVWCLCVCVCWGVVRGYVYVCVWGLSYWCVRAEFLCACVIGVSIRVCVCVCECLVCLWVCVCV